MRSPKLHSFVLSSFFFLSLLNVGHAAPDPLAAQIESAVAEAARSSGHMVPRPDAGLAAAAADLARLSTDDALASGGDLVSDALNLHGVVQPAPHLVLASSANGGEAGMLTDLRRRLPELLGAGRFRLLGVGVVRPSPKRVRVVLALIESFVELDPVQRSVTLPAGAKIDVPVLIAGVLLPPYGRPELLLTDPKGQVARVAVVTQPAQVPIVDRDRDREGEAATQGIRFGGTFHCLARGRYQIEVAGEDKLGSTVLANFPIYCGEAAPTALGPRPTVPDRAFKDAGEVESQLLVLLQADRARAGLPALLSNAALTAVARAHSLDMRDHDFLGHISPTTGDASDRARKAGIHAPVLLENLARAYSSPEAERSLMESPGHRANILSKDVTEVGIGVQVKTLPGGLRELFVTQLFRRAPEEYDPERTSGLALSRVQSLRETGHVPPLTVDPELTELARSTAMSLSQGKIAEDKVGEPARTALGKMQPARYRLLRTVLAVTTDVKSMSPSPALLDPAVRGIGLWAAPAKTDGKADGKIDPKRQLSGAVYVVIVLAEPSKK